MQENKKLNPHSDFGVSKIYTQRGDSPTTILSQRNVAEDILYHVTAVGVFWCRDHISVYNQSWSWE